MMIHSLKFRRIYIKWYNSKSGDTKVIETINLTVIVCISDDKR